MKKLSYRLFLIFLIVLPLAFIVVCEADEAGSSCELVPIFMYHNFTESAHVDEGKEGLYVSGETFEEQLKYLKEKDCISIDFSQLDSFLKDGVPLPHNSFMITIDDVYKQQYTIAYPLLKKYGFKATLFINTDSVGKNGTYTWEELKEMEDSGCIDVQSHGEFHIDMRAAAPEDAIANVSNSFDRIEQNLGPRNIRVFCYPSYSSSKRTRVLLSDITDMQVTKLGKYVYKSSSEDNIHRFRASNWMTGKDMYKFIDSVE